MLIYNKISLNCSKTEIICFHRQGEVAPDLKIKVNSARIISLNYSKYQGVNLDETHSGNHHYSLLVKKRGKKKHGICAEQIFKLQNRAMRIINFVNF